MWSTSAEGDLASMSTVSSAAMLVLFLQRLWHFPHQISFEAWSWDRSPLSPKVAPYRVGPHRKTSPWANSTPGDHRRIGEDQDTTWQLCICIWHDQGTISRPSCNLQWLFRDSLHHQHSGHVWDLLTNWLQRGLQDKLRHLLQIHLPLLLSCRKQEHCRTKLDLSFK